MNIDVRPAAEHEKTIIQAMLVPYLAELRVSTDYPYLPLYWKDQGRFPYLFLRGPQAIGFALVRRIDDVERFEMAEFYIAPPYRKAGAGARCAASVFSLHPGNWELSVLSTNAAGQNFWRRILRRSELIADVCECHIKGHLAFWFAVASPAAS